MHLSLPLPNVPYFRIAFLLALGLQAQAAIGPYQDRPHIPLVSIADIQGEVNDTDNGEQHASPFADRTIQVQGIVHQRLRWATRNGEARYGVLLQTAKPLQDDNANTSEGLLFYSGHEAALPKKDGQYTPQVGDEVIVSGVLKERFGQTELGEVQLEQLLRRDLDLDEWVPAIPVNPPADWAEAMRYWERLEGMRVQVPDGVLAVSARKVDETTLDGMIEVINPGQAVAMRENVYARRVFRDAHPLDDVPDELFDNGNGYRYVLSSFGIKSTEKNHRELILPASTFDVLSGERSGGVLYNWGRFKVAITDQVSLTHETEAADNHAPPIPADDRLLSIATYNVENLFDLRNDPEDGCDFPDDPGCPGVRKPYDYVPEEQTWYEHRLVKIARHIVERLHAPDILMFQELEDQDMLGMKNRNDALEDLAAQILLQGGPVYSVTNDRRGADDRGIICGFLYKTERIKLMRPSRRHPVLGKAKSIQADLTAFSDNLRSRNPKAFNSSYVWTDAKGEQEEPVFSRAVQVAGFYVYESKRGRGKPKSLYVLNNHFSSRPDASVERRKQQAAYNADIYRVLKKYDSKALVIMGGDLNIYPRPDDPLPKIGSDQLATLYNSGMVSLYDQLLKTCPEAAYSYVYHGQAQTLDHLFVGPLLFKGLESINALHVNADYPYSTEVDEPYGASDHDPLLARFKLW